MRKLAISLFFLASCAKSTKQEVLPPLKMRDVLWDYVRADIYTNEYIRLDSTRNYKEEYASMLKTIFERHKVGSAVFFKSLKYYEENPELIKPILDSIVFWQYRNAPEVITSIVPMRMDSIELPMLRKGFHKRDTSIKLIEDE